MIHPDMYIAKRLNDMQKVITEKHTVCEMVSDLLALSDEQWGRYAFAHDPLGHRFTGSEKDRLTKMAVRCGRSEARKVNSLYAGKTIGEIAKAMGIDVHLSSRPTGSGAMIFARYIEPARIEVFTDCCVRAEKMVRQEQLGEPLESADFQDILMAHELFHSVEYRNKKTIFTQTEKIELWHKPFSNRSKILALGEIAAMAFAEELTACGFMPYVLDVLLICDVNYEAACALYEEILETAGIRERIWNDAGNDSRAR